MLFYEIRGQDVVEVTTGRDGQERLEFHGCDHGEALVVGHALAQYWEAPIMVAQLQEEAFFSLAVSRQVREAHAHR